MTLRTDRVASLIREEIGGYVIREFRDPAYGLITVTEVIVTPDLRLAKVYISILGSPEVKAATMKMLEEHKGEIRSYIGSRVRVKFTPSIHFYIDETLDRVEKINNLIRKIHSGDASKPE
jgi:ribosome-binding factor A